MSYLDPRSFVGVEQIVTILDYMKENPQLAHGRFSRTKEGRNLVQQHWAACAELANNVSSECVQKTPEQWRAYFTAYKSKVKKKINAIKAEIIATGEPPARKKLTDLENKMFLMLGPDLGDGYPRVCNTPIARLEMEHQPSSSTAEFLPKEDCNFTIGSDSSECELYYPEDDVKTCQLIADTLDLKDQQMNPMVYTAQELKPLVHKREKSLPEEYAKHQREPVYRSQQIPVHSNPELASVGRNDQGFVSVDNTAQDFGPAALTDQRSRPDFHTECKMEPATQADQQPVTGGSSQNKSENAAPQRSQCETRNSQDNDSVSINGATEALLTIERMKVETKREATAAVNRLAGALEAIAEKLGGLHKLRSTSPPRAKRRYARISSSESN